MSEPVQRAEGIPGSNPDDPLAMVTESMETVTRGLKLADDALALRHDLIRQHEARIASVGISARPQQLTERMAEADAEIARVDESIRKILDALWKATTVCIESAWKVTAGPVPWRPAAAPADSP